MKLYRLVQTDAATFGRLEGNDRTDVGKTLELPWRDNHRSISCIPAGTYECKRYLSPKRGYELFEICGVPNRSNVEFHAGNTVLDTEGCVLIGSTFGKLDGKEAVLRSKPAFQRFMDYLKGRDTFTLTIEDPPIA